MKSRRLLGIFILSILSSVLFAQELPESPYWDDIELRDGQVLRGVIVDRVKGEAIIQLSTRDFITLPETSIVRVKKGVARSGQKPVSVSVGVSVDLSLTTPASSQQKAQWAARWASRTSARQASTIELTDGTLLEGHWVETEAGYAVIVLADGAVTGVSRAKIRRVTAVDAPSRAGTVEPAVLLAPEPEPSKPQPDLLEPLVSAWAVVNQGPVGSDATPFRTFALPKAQTLAAGDFVLSQLDLVATQATWGVTDELQLQAGLTLPSWVFPLYGSLAQVGVQYGMTLPSVEVGSWRLAILNWFLFRQEAQQEGGKSVLGRVYGYLLPATVLTASFGAWDISASAGLWKGLQEGEFRLTTAASIMGRLGPHWAVVGDWGGSWEMEASPENWFSGVWGFRYWNTWVTLDFGVQISALLGKQVWVPVQWWETPRTEYRSEWSTPVILPVFNASFRP